jgi:hypothetical protein
MSDNPSATYSRENLLESFAAELTNAAYCIALRQGMRGSWLDLELGLWKVLAETVEMRAREWPPPGPADEVSVTKLRHS